MSGFGGSSAIDPTSNEGCVSVSGVQLPPPSVVFQTPPSADPRYATFALRGSTTRAVMRPDAEPQQKSISGRGPMSVHCEVEPGAAGEAALVGPLGLACPKSFASSSRI